MALKEANGQYMWKPSNMLATWTNWADDQPNQGATTCGAMVNNGQWNDRSCGATLMSICEHEPWFEWQ